MADAGENAASTTPTKSSKKSIPMGLLQWYVKTVVKRPACVALLGLSFPIFISMIAFVAYPIEIDTSGGSFYPRSSTIGKLEDTIKISEEKTVFNPYDTLDVQVLQQTDNQYTLDVLYWTGDYNILTTEGVEIFRKIENHILDHVENEKTFEDVCLRDPTGTFCEPVSSLTSFIYAETSDDCPGIRIPNGKGTSQFDVTETLELMSYGNATNGSVYCFPSNTSCYDSCIEPSTTLIDEYVSNDFTLDNPQTHVSRSTFKFGLPLAGYKNARDSREEQITKIEDWIASLKGFLDNADEGNVEVLYLSDILIEMHFNDVILNDTLFVIMSIVLVYLFMWIHVQSLFVASFGILHIILSFPFAYFFLQLFLDIGPMGVLNFMALFIILGIGADDVFIYVDAWKQSGHYIQRGNFEESSEGKTIWLERRFEYAYRRSAWAMLVTSLTTSAAFLMNLTSSVPPIQIFGFFTAFMVMTNYFMVITYFPALVMWWARDVEQLFSCGCAQDAEKFKTESMNEEGAVSKDGVNTDNVGDLRFLEKFFHNLYAPAIHKNRFYVLAGFFVFLALSIAYASQLTGSDEPTKWLPDDDPVQKAFLVEGQDFSRSGVTLQVYFVHGLDTINRAGTNQFDSADIGKVNFDEDFDPSSPNFQQTYLEFCDRMKTWEHVLNGEVFCPMYLFKEFVEDILQESFPVPDDQFVAKMANYTAWYEEVNGPTPDFSIQNDPGEREDRRFSGASIYNLIRFEPNDPTKLRYLATVANMSLGILDPVGDIEPVYDDFEARMKEENRNSSMQAVTLGDGFQTASRWVDMELDRVLLRSALVGIGASLTIAFVIILASTTDLILTLLSMVSIGGTVASLIAMVVWIGWKMSIVESICLTILVGLSVDYTIHLANSWRHSTTSDDRKVRLQKTLTEIGISVLSASVTTFLSCLALFFTIVLFFVKFGIFIALTILFSTIYSFGMLTAMLAIWGPVDNRNDFVYLYNLVTGKDTKVGNANAVVDSPPPATGAARLAHITEM